MNNLVIVESPTKGRTISRFLGSEYQIEASMGHVRDLPKSDLGVDVEHNFEPRYIVPRDKSKRINQLKKIISSAKNIWLATDPDREGEAIAWHLSELLSNSENPKSEIRNPKLIKRVVFHEITEGAIKEAFNHPRGIDLRLVDAQQARRVLDRLVGYKLSPLLWKKVKSGLSAGRVQSVALKLIVEREEEIKLFKAEEYWSIEADLSSSPTKNFTASLIELNGKKLTIKNQIEANTHLYILEKTKFQVSAINKKEVRRYPQPPFTTSTLQQTAANRLGFSAKRTMMLAQNLYEQGLITYMRTDSVNLSTTALDLARELISKQFGALYLPAKARVFKARSKLVQEAHEAIRPTEVNRQSTDIKEQSEITRDHLRLYDLVWKRMMASQISEAVVDQTSVDIKADEYLFRATGSVVKFDGWLKVYGIKDDQETDQEKTETDKVLPELKKHEDLNLIQITPTQHFTEPPPRFTEASLIKKLEELGIGRPSTYAPTISTIMDRFYVERMERKFVPTEIGITVTKFLREYFPDIIDYSFTAEMEDKLDEIAKGEIKWQPVIAEFYMPFAKKVEKTTEEASRVELVREIVDEKCPNCNKNLLIKYGRFGKFLACSGFPECKFTKSFEEKIDAKCPKCDGDIIIKRTKRKKPFYGCSNYPKCDYASWNRPK